MKSVFHICYKDITTTGLWSQYYIFVTKI